MPDTVTFTTTVSGYTEVFTTEDTGKVFGYRLVGAAAGPQIVVASTCPSARTVFERLLAIPTLPWMRGNLVLIQLDALEDIARDMSSLTSLGAIDRTVILPCDAVNETKEAVTRRNYHLVLRTCAQMGMITGRGVARA